MEYTRINDKGAEGVQREHMLQNYMQATQDVLGTEAEVEMLKRIDAAGLEVHALQAADAAEQHRQAQMRVDALRAMLGAEAPDTAKRDARWLEGYIEEREREHAVYLHRRDHPELYPPVQVAVPGMAPQSMGVAPHAEITLTCLDARHAWAVEKLAAVSALVPPDPPAEPVKLTGQKKAPAATS